MASLEPWRITPQHDLYSSDGLPPPPPRQRPHMGTRFARMKLKVQQFLLYICSGLGCPHTPLARRRELILVSAIKKKVDFSPL